jgi:hypothetical protein
LQADTATSIKGGKDRKTEHEGDVRQIGNIGAK